VIRRLFVSAIAAGVLAGLIISAIHQFTTVPIILHAESFENEAARAETVTVDRAIPVGFPLGNPAFPSDPRHLFAHGGETHDGNPAWAPRDGAERIAFTVMTTVLTGIGFALVLVAGMMVRGKTVDFRRGVMWGAGGFVAFTLAPTMGLAPEVPGAAAADLVARQIWWISTAITALAGLWMLVFTPGTAWKVAGVVLLAAPHVVGAPHPHELGTGGAPAELAAQFAATSIATAAVFWALLGGFAGYFLGRAQASA